MKASKLIELLQSVPPDTEVGFSYSARDYIGSRLVERDFSSLERCPTVYSDNHRASRVLVDPYFEEEDREITWVHILI